MPVPVRDVSYDEWWARTTALAGPLAARLAALPSSVRAAIETDLREAVRPFSTPRGLEFPGVTVLAGARHA
jgi:hypothetical protein